MRVDQQWALSFAPHRQPGDAGRRPCWRCGSRLVEPHYAHCLPCLRSLDRQEHGAFEREMTRGDIRRLYLRAGPCSACGLPTHDRRTECRDCRRRAQEAADGRARRGMAAALAHVAEAQRRRLT